MSCGQIRLIGRVKKINPPVKRGSKKDPIPAATTYFSITTDIKMADFQHHTVKTDMDCLTVTARQDSEESIISKLDSQLSAMLRLLEFDTGRGNFPPLARYFETIILDTKITDNEKSTKINHIITVLDKCRKLCELSVAGEYDIIVKRYFRADKHKRQYEYANVISQLLAECANAQAILQEANNEAWLKGNCLKQLHEFNSLCRGEKKIDDARNNVAVAAREATRTGTDDMNSVLVDCFNQNGPQNGAIAGGLAAIAQVGAIYFIPNQGKFADFRIKLAKDLLMLNYQKLCLINNSRDVELDRQVAKALEFRRGAQYKNSWPLKKILLNTSSSRKMSKLQREGIQVATSTVKKTETAAILPTTTRNNLKISLLNAADLNLSTADGLRLLGILAPVLQKMKRKLPTISASEFESFKNQICQNIRHNLAISLDDELADNEDPELSNKIFFKLLHFCLNDGLAKTRARRQGSLRQYYATILTKLFQTPEGRVHLEEYFKYTALEEYMVLQESKARPDFEYQAFCLLKKSSKLTYSNNLMLIMIALDKNKYLSAIDKEQFRDYLVQLESNPNFGHLFAITNQHRANLLKNGFTTGIRYALHNTPAMQGVLGVTTASSPGNNFMLQTARWGQWQGNITLNNSSHHKLPRTHSANTALEILKWSKEIKFGQGTKCEQGIYTQETTAGQGENKLQREINFYDKYAKFTLKNGKWQPNIYHDLQDAIKKGDNRSFKDRLRAIRQDYPIQDYTIDGHKYYPQRSCEDFMLFAARLPWDKDRAMLTLLYLQSLLLDSDTKDSLLKQEILDLILSGGLYDSNSVVHQLTRHSANKTLAYNLGIGVLGAALYALTIALIPVHGIPLVLVKLLGNTTRMCLSNPELIQRGVNLIPYARPNRYKAPQEIFKYCRKLLLEQTESNDITTANHEPPTPRLSTTLNELPQNLTDSTYGSLDSIPQKTESSLGSSLASSSQSLSETNELQKQADSLDSPQLLAKFKQLKNHEERLEHLLNIFTNFGKQNLDRNLAQRLAQQLINHSQMEIGSHLWGTFGDEANKYRALFFAILILEIKSKSLFAVLRHHKFSSKKNLAISAFTTLAPSMFTDLGVATELGLAGLAVDAAGGGITGLNNPQAQSRYNRTDSYNQIIKQCKEQIRLSLELISDQYSEQESWAHESKQYRIIISALSVKRFNFKNKLKNPITSLAGISRQNRLRHYGIVTPQ